MKGLKKSLVNIKYLYPFGLELYHYFHGWSIVRAWRNILLILLFNLFALQAPLALQGSHTGVRGAIRYQLSIRDVVAQIMEVTITVAKPAGPVIDLAIPAWTPGYYQILHYEADVSKVRLVQNGPTDLVVSHPQTHIWRVARRDGDDQSPLPEFSLTYYVHTHDDGLGFFGSVLRENQAEGYVNGASVFMYVVGSTDHPVECSVSTPPRWRVASPLSTSSSGAFFAPDYDAFIDCPIQLGTFDSAEFTVDGVPIECVLVGNHKADLKHLESSLRRIVHAGFRLFPGKPFERYVFIYHCGGAGFPGGLEHRNSTVIHLNAPILNADSDEFMEVTAHEFIHAWNVKRLRPLGLGPFDYGQPVRTASLWWAEGVTDYYAEVLLLRSGLRNRVWFLKNMANRITELDRTHARSRVNLEEASRKAWEGESEGFAGLNYYIKGSLVGFYFDTRIRDLTEGRVSLDDTMRELMAKYADQGMAYPESALLAAINHASGADLSGEYAAYVRGTQDFAWDTLFASVGIEMQRAGHAYLGVELDRNGKVIADGGHEAVIQTVAPNSAAKRMGLKAGDTIKSINGRSVTSETLASIMRSLPGKSQLNISIDRSGRSVDIVGRSGLQYADTVLGMAPDSQMSERTHRVRDGLLETGETQG